MFNLTEVEKAYIAGIVDGEGHIGVNQQPNGNLALVLMVVNTNKELIEWLAQKLNASFFLRNVNESKWKDCYAIHLYGKRAKEVLGCILPYLVSKKKLAEIALGFPIRQSGPKTTATKEVSEEELQQAICFVQMRKLNKRGRDLEEERQ